MQNILLVTCNGGVWIFLSEATGGAQEGQPSSNQTADEMKGIGDAELANVREQQRREEVNRVLEMSLAKVPGDEKIYVSGLVLLFHTSISS